MADNQPNIYRFKATIAIIGVNPYVTVPEKILQAIFKAAGKDKGPIPISGTVNDKPYQQTLVKYSGAWRLYINTAMLKNSPQYVGSSINITVSYDPASRAIEAPESFVKALAANPQAQSVFDALPASRRLEIVRYLARLKTAQALEKNIPKAMDFLLGKARFVGRDKP
jgi:Bacteriocin-protection, YdeI or OmpD-Associated/Domain of unknown function (DUF1905)